MTQILAALALRLPDGLQPYAKAVIPALGTILAVLAQFAATGELDRAELATGITGGVAALVTFLTPNRRAS